MKTFKTDNSEAGKARRAKATNGLISKLRGLGIQIGQDGVSHYIDDPKATARRLALIAKYKIKTVLDGR
jgi:hypothetical protein